MIRERSSIGSRFGLVIVAGTALALAACGSSSPATGGKGGSGGGAGGAGGSTGKGGSGGGTGGGAGGSTGQGGVTGTGGSGGVTCVGTPQYNHTSGFGAILDGWMVSSQYSSPDVAPGTDSDGGATGTKISIDPNDGSPTNGSLQLDIPFGGPSDLLLLQELYNTPQNFTDTMVTAQIKLVSGTGLATLSDTITAYLTLKSTAGYVYAAGTALALDPSLGFQTISIDPDAATIAGGAAGFTACDIRELDIEIHTGATGTYKAATILIDTIAIAPKHPSDGGTGDASDATTSSSDASGGSDSAAD
jgi:hypothetical protein